MTRSKSRINKRELTLNALASATRQTPHTLHHIVTQFERYTGIEIQRVGQGRAMILHFTPEQFQFMRRAIEFVRAEKGTYLDFFKLHTMAQHHALSSEVIPFILTTQDWHNLLNRVEGIEQQLMTLSAQLELVLSILPEKRRTKKKKPPQNVPASAELLEPVESADGLL